MYNVTQNFLNIIKQGGRQFKATVTIRDVVLDDNSIIELSLNEDVNPADNFMLGAVASNSLDIAITNPSTTLVLEGAQVNPVIGLYTGSKYEDVPLGVFWVDKPDKNKNTVKLTCFDSMIKLEKAYFSNLTYPASINSVAQEICSKAGVQLATALPSTKINKIEGCTYREAISYIASFLGGFARFNREGKLEIISYVSTGITITGGSYFKLKTNERPFTIGKLTCKVGKNVLTAGSNGNEIQFENPIMTQTQLNSIYNTLKNLSYMPFNMDWQGNHALQAGDKIAIIDEKGNTHNTLLMQQKITYKGSISATAAAVGKTEQAQEFSSGGSLSNKVERIVMEQANIKVLLAEKATIEDLTATNAEIENLVATKATIVQLNAANAKIDNLIATTATITQLNALKATVDDLTANKANIIDLTAANGRITTLESKEATIDNLLAGNLSAKNMQANFITAESGLIANGAIKDAMIDTVSVNKVLAGNISTNKFTVVSDSGNLKIQGNTLHVWDTTGKERISLGLNGTDYNLTVRAADGTTVMFGANGVTNAGITSGAVDDSKVAVNANINGSKIEKESLVTRINGATTLLNASKVKLDTENQTLDVAFKSLKSTVTSTANAVTSQGTTISAIQGQIQAKIWQQDIDTLEDILDTRITATETSITALNGTVNLKVSTSDFNSYKTSNDSAISSLTNRVSAAELKITDSAIVSTVRSSSAYLGDLALKERAITKSNTAPSSPESGQLWLDTSATPNILKRYTGSTWVKVTPTTASEVGAYSGSDGVALAGRMSTAESSITQLNNSISSKVSQTDFNTLTGRVSTAESNITQLSGQISSKVSTTDFNSYKSQTATEIASKVSSSTYNSFVSQTNSALNSKVSVGDFGTLVTQNSDSVRVAVGQIGGENLVKNGRGALGTDGWIGSAAVVTTEFLPDLGVSSIKIGNNSTTSAKYGTTKDWIYVKSHTTYTLSFLVWPQVALSHFQACVKGSDDGVIKWGPKTVFNNKYNRVNLTFNTGSYAKIYPIFYLGEVTSGTGYAWLTDVCIREGNNPEQTWTPNPNELKNSSFEVTDDHARFTSADGSYTEFVPDSTGLKWHKQKGGIGRDYHYLMYSDTATVWNNHTTTVNLPSEFKNKDCKILVSVKSCNAGASTLLNYFNCFGTVDSTNLKINLSGYALSSLLYLHKIYESWYDANYVYHQVLHGNTDIVADIANYLSMEVAYLIIA